MAVAALLALALGACGSSNDNGGDVNSGAPVKGKKGGTLKVARRPATSSTSTPARSTTSSTTR